ncbi:hypothetical protein MKW92_015281 [Papaver armeniacum]|nr:hypothetical protein MKW92_015281 [Papaver armeniacum]
MTTAIQVFVICLLCHVFSMIHADIAAVSSGKLVTYLPGLEVQPLPFHLETGYIGVGSGSESSTYEDDIVHEMFYYFVKSERNPKEDPLVLWLAGGPFCPGLSNLAIGIGPILIAKVVEYNNGSLPTLTLNPNSWTKVANIIFLDAPVGAGFSYSKSAYESPIGDILSAENTYEFLIKIRNPEFQSNQLYISGESKSGFLVPVIVQDMIRDIEDGKYPFLNFKGYLLGNPGTYTRLEENARVQLAHNLGFISYELYQSMRVSCKGNFLNFDLSNSNCSKDQRAFEELISGINEKQVMEPQCDNTLIPSFKPKEMIENGRRRSLVNIEEGLVAENHLLPPSCLRVLLEYWANDDGVRKALHTREGTTKKWVRCNRDLRYGIELESCIEYHHNISTKGYRSLIYNGDLDTVVPHISTEAWIRTLTNFSITDDWRPWFLSDQVAGYTRTYSNGLTYGAGHSAPVYKPKECYAMFERWILNTPL